MMIDRGPPFRPVPYPVTPGPGSLAATAVFSLAGTVVLLVVELVLTMLVYTYLNLAHLDTFGWMVRQARVVLDLLAGQLEFWMPAGSNAAYATLIGELGPKSILLLIIGLVVGSLVRGFLKLFHG